MENYNFSSDYQDLILACWMRHPDKFLVYGQVLRSDYFNGLNSILAAKCIIDCITKYGVAPTPTVLGQMMATEVKKLGNEDQAQDAYAYIQKLASVDTRNVDEVRERVVAFCRERAVVGACSKIVESQKTGTADKINAVRLVEEALMVGYDLQNDGIHLNQDYMRVIDTVTSVNYGIRTGYPILDDIWKSGWGPGWLVTIVAPPKRYKTAFSLNLALNMASPQIGQDVLYYACEIGQDLAAWRMLLRLAGMKDDEARQSPIEFKENAYDGMCARLQNNIWLKGFSSKMATIQDIRLHARHIINTKGIHPKAIFIDHAETVRPSTALNKNTPDHRQQSDIYTEARALGQELGCTVVMPDRCNKETVDRAVPDMKSFQGAFEKAGIVDVAIGLCATPKEHLENKIRAFVFLNRHGSAFHHIGGTVDPTIFSIEFTDRLVYDPEAGEHAPRRQRADLGYVEDERLAEGRRPVRG